MWKWLDLFDQAGFEATTTGSKSNHHSSLSSVSVRSKLAILFFKFHFNRKILARKFVMLIGRDNGWVMRTAEIVHGDFLRVAWHEVVER